MRQGRGGFFCKRCNCREADDYGRKISCAEIRSKWDRPWVGRDQTRFSRRNCTGVLTKLRNLESVHHALDLCVAGGVPRQNYFDRQLASLMIRENIAVIFTENVKDFSGIEDITPLNPFA